MQNLLNLAAPLFSWVWQASLQASIVIALVLLVQRLLGSQLAPRWHAALWLLVAARLLVPWSLPSPVSVFNWVGPALLASTSHQPAPASFAEVNPESPEAEPSPVPPTPQGSRWGLLHWVWLAGAAGLLGYVGVTNLRLGCRVKRQRPVTDERVLNLLEDCKAEMGLNTPLTVVETAAVQSPALFGFIRPRLLLPSGLTKNFSREELRFVFLHELGHLKRGDIPLNWLMTAPLIFHWFNPLIWFAFRQMRVDQELACDALALTHAQEAEKRPYGQTILKLVESFSRPAVGPGLVGILENNHQMKKRINMIATFKKSTTWPVAAAALFAALGIVTLTDAQSGQATGAADSQRPPRIVSTSPEVGAVDVDPGLTEITVTFDRDMAGGFSWTGGGPEYPASPEGKKPVWRNKRTCALPVQLQAARYYRVGINSTSYQNFKSAGGVPASPSAIYFATKGASEELKRKVSKPQIVGLVPKNGTQDVDPNLTELRVTFNVPMAAGFSWTGGGPEFPPIPEGKKPSWLEDKKTCILPVQLQPGSSYRLGLNSMSHKNFQSAGGIPLDPVVYTFKTRN